VKGEITMAMITMMRKSHDTPTPRPQQHYWMAMTMMTNRRVGNPVTEERGGQDKEEERQDKKQEVVEEGKSTGKKGKQ